MVKFQVGISFITMRYKKRDMENIFGIYINLSIIITSYETIRFWINIRCTKKWKAKKEATTIEIIVHDIDLIMIDN